jgi:hypothetical protein
VHPEFFPPSQTVNQNFQNAWGCWFVLWGQNFSQQMDSTPDNAPSHSAYRQEDYDEKQSVTGTKQPTYSPELTLCGCFLYPTVKCYLMK